MKQYDNQNNDQKKKKIKKKLLNVIFVFSFLLKDQFSDLEETGNWFGNSMCGYFEIFNFHLTFFIKDLSKSSVNLSRYLDD